MINEKQGLRAEQPVDKQVRYGIRKMKVGVVSVAVATGLIFSSNFLLTQVHAETLSDATLSTPVEPISETQPELNEEATDTIDPITMLEVEFETDQSNLAVETVQSEEEREVLTELAPTPSDSVESLMTVATDDSTELIETQVETDIIAEATTEATEVTTEPTEATAETAETTSETTEVPEATEPTETPTMFTMARNRVFAATETDEVKPPETDAASETETSETTEVSTTAATDTEAVAPIEEGYFRLNFEGLTTEQLDTYGLWYWGDVSTPSDTVGGWPDGATSFSTATATAFGHYLDVELKENAQTINFLINTRTGDNVTPDLSIDLMSPNMNQAYITEDYAIKLYEQLEDEGLLRINYYREDGNYDGWGLWAWGDVAEPTTEWPTGAHEFINEGAFGRYVDLSLAEAASNINFLIVNRDTGEQSNDMTFNDRETHSQVFIKDLDKTVYTNPYYARVDRLETAEIISDSQIELNYSSVESLSEAAILEEVTIVDAAGNQVEVTGVVIDAETGKIQLTGAFDYLEAPYTVQHGDQSLALQLGWRIKDELYAYDGELGMALNEDGTAEMAFWSPSADQVNIVLYDKTDQNRTVNSLAMTKEDRGVWRLELNEETTDLTDLTGYYYHLEIVRGDETVLALDPYAKSLAAWDNLTAEHNIAKAAIINPSTIGPELDYADIPGYEKREDAIIYEVHVRDFTSDPSIEEELTAQFGTFAAFVDKLDYIESLGVTHIQLLPVMSYYFANDFANGERSLDYASTDQNYNWGYDPQSYFSLTGMYSENPEDPAKRIEEFKSLINEIHKRDMGVILDVVYNHTAQTHLFEDLEPNYYHFMDADGTPRESFGGGRLGTTHHMARRVMVDSIKYWVDEFKVDGFRFDMMGDHDAEAIQEAFDSAAALNPNMLMIGEGWITFEGDETDQDVQAADQLWMIDTDSVGVFSDEVRNELKSGFGSEGEPRFLTGGARNIQLIFQNIMGNPSNFTADAPGDVVQYIAAHDNLTLHDVIAQSIKKDPKDHSGEIHQRIRIGNLMVLTSQGTPFIHSGQEYGRTKQYRHEDYITTVADGSEPYKSTYMTDADGKPFEYPYFVHDSYDSSDAVNMFNWEQATNSELYPIQGITQSYTTGLIQLRRYTDAFRQGTAEDVAANVSLITSPEIGEEDLVIGYQAIDSNGDIYVVFINADENLRSLTLTDEFAYIAKGEIIVDGLVAGTEAIANPTGVMLADGSLTLDPLTATIIRLKASETETVTEDIAFETIESDSDAVATGERQVLQAGVNGERTITYLVRYEKGVEVSREIVSSEVTREAINQLVEVGVAVAEAETEPNPMPQVPVEASDLTLAKAQVLPNTGENSNATLLGAVAIVALSGGALVGMGRKRETDKN
ncbi:pullulanase [Fundicoccus sp. Sow4_D5]|uniref:pullulanase n=1 Tax=Fundicoccus sp. Sow4_D5 TaxID=3438782 RepID=UPI003F8F0D86